MTPRILAATLVVACATLFVASTAHAQGPTNPTAPLCTVERFHQGFNHLVGATWTAYDGATDPSKTLGRNIPGEFVEYGVWWDDRFTSTYFVAKPYFEDGDVRVYASADARAVKETMYRTIATSTGGQVYARGPMLVTTRRDYLPEQAAIFESILGEACP